MGLYTITISPDDGSGAQTTVTVDVDGDVMRVMEVNVRSATGGGLVGGRMPDVDFDLLLRAINPGRGAGQPGAAADESAAPAESAAPRRTQPAAQSTAPRGAAEGPRRRGKPKVETSVPPSSLGGRAYRKMPDDLAEVYERTQSVTAVAQHFGVPRHTAQGWMNRLRQQVQGQ
ncbi:hypothetical protein ABZS66_54735 [Dactylosporangium sp. NPDC005572]|uniref:hypothetical protein n=1 Tax=Dactylosporangium sp. NPDC005572 TaxID=3156889 RepID=UPI0033B5501E